MEQRMGRPSKVSDEQVRVAVGEARNMRQLLALLGLAEHGGNYESIRARLRRLGIEEPRFFPSRAEAPEVTDEEMARIVAAADSYAEVARLLGLGNSTAAQRRAKRMVVKSGHDISHFLGQSWNRGLGLGGREPEPLERLLVQGRLVPTDRLRKRLIEGRPVARLL